MGLGVDRATNDDLRLGTGSRGSGYTFSPELLRVV
jgi:hypothetical protein